MQYSERHWMTDNPAARENALTYSETDGYAVRQWDPKYGWFPTPFGTPIWWRPLPKPPIGKDESFANAIED